MQLSQSQQKKRGKKKRERGRKVVSPTTVSSLNLSIIISLVAFVSTKYPTTQFTHELHQIALRTLRLVHNKKKKNKKKIGITKEWIE